MWAEAVAALKQARSLSEKHVLITGMLGYSLGRLNKGDEARELLMELEAIARERYVSPISFYLIAHGGNDIDKALDLLEKAYEERSSSLVRIKVDHKVDDLRAHPRFIEIARKMHFV